MFKSVILAAIVASAAAFAPASRLVNGMTSQQSQNYILCECSGLMCAP